LPSSPSAPSENAANDKKEPQKVTAEGGAAVAKQSVKSSVLLAAGNFIETVVLVVAALIIARLLGPSGYGLFTLALTVPLFLYQLVDFGVMYAIQRNAAYHLSKGEEAIARRMTKNGILFILISGLAFSAVCFFGAGFFSSYVLHRPGLALYLDVGSVLVVSEAVFAAVTVAFLGWGSANYTSGLNVSQAAFKLLLAPLLIVLGFGVLGAVEGHVLSYLIGAIIGMATIYFLKLRMRTKPKMPAPSAASLGRAEPAAAEIGPSPPKISPAGLVAKDSALASFVKDVKQMVGYGIPIYAANGLTQFAGTTFIFFLLSGFVPNDTIGFYQAAFNVSTGIATLSLAISFSLFSAFSSLDALSADVRMPFRYSVKYVSLVLMPVMFFAIGAASPLTVVFYGRRYAEAGNLLSYLEISYLPWAFGLTVFPSFFNGIGKPRMTLMLQLVGAIVIFFLAPLLEYDGFGVLGAIYSLVASTIAATGVGAYLAKRYTDSTIDYVAAARIFLASDISFVAIYFLQQVLAKPDVVALLLDFVAFFGLYLTIGPILRTVSLEDFDRLRSSMTSLGFLQRPLDLVLRYEIFMFRKTSFLARTRSEIN
jgi:O-antigen/teichoic acid export membrane protein